MHGKQDTGELDFQDSFPLNHYLWTNPQDIFGSTGKTKSVI